jgi:glucokinase
VPEVVVGIDLGGTSVRAAVAPADAPGDVLASVVASTSTAGANRLVDQIVELAVDAVERSGRTWADVGALTVGVPGVVGADGRVRVASNVVGLSGTAVRDDVSARLPSGSSSVAVAVENDVNLAALGEQNAGVAQGSRSFAVVSIGTGIGCAIVIDGQLVRGAHRGAGELGLLQHEGVPIERLASGPGIEAAAGQRATDVLDLVAKGDPDAVGVLAPRARLVAQAVIAVALVVDPEMVVLGGGVGSHPAMLDEVRRAVHDHAPLPVTVVASSLGDRAGVVGALADAATRMRTR